MTLSVVNFKFNKVKIIFGYHTKGVPNQVSSNSKHVVKSYPFSNSSTKKRKYGKNVSGFKAGQ